MTFSHEYKLSVSQHLSSIFLAIAILNFALDLWLGALNVFRRDINALTPFLLRLDLFISPVAYTLDSVPEQWRTLYCFNPLVAITESMRFCILGEQFRPDWSCFLAGSFTLAALFYFNVLFSAIKRRCRH